MRRRKRGWRVHWVGTVQEKHASDRLQKYPFCKPGLSLQAFTHGRPARRGDDTTYCGIGSGSIGPDGRLDLGFVGLRLPGFGMLARTCHCLNKRSRAAVKSRQAAAVCPPASIASSNAFNCFSMRATRGLSGGLSGVATGGGECHRISFARMAYWRAFSGVNRMFPAISRQIAGNARIIAKNLLSHE